MFGYVYLVRNKIDGKQYIGQKHSDIFLPEYLGSGVYLKNAVEKYGKENFEHVKILEWCESKEDLDKAEIYWINYYDAVNSPMFYNLACGGKGTITGSKHSDIWKSKIAIATSQRVWTEESRKKLSKSITGRVWVNNSVIERQVTKNEAEKLLNEGFSFGRLPFTKEHLEKVGNTRRGHCYESTESLKKRSQNMKGSGNPFYGKTHSDEQKLKWRKVRREMVWVTKDGVSTTIHNSKLQDYLDDGWIRGRKKKSSTTIESIGSKKDTTE